MTKLLEGRVALVTGAGSGIGKTEAEVLAAQGASVIVNDFNAEAAQATASAIIQAGGQAIACPGDVGDSRVITDAIQTAARQAGDIDILVNNAGIAGKRGAFHDIDDEQLDRMFQIHVKGSWYCTRAVLPGMKEKRRGKIINTSSILGMAGRTRASHYAGAKAAVIGLTKAWAREFAEWNIHVNAVAPGRIRTPILGDFADTEEYKQDLLAKVPLRRRGEPEDIAWLVAFLASHQADYITGQIISPNGGEVI